MARFPIRQRSPRLIRSMTGFGEASTEAEGVHYALELRSLNNKFFKASMRLPDSIQGLEAELETALRKKVQRGSFTLTLRMRASDAHAASRVNEEAVLAYLDHLETIHTKVPDRTAHIDLTELLSLPGVLTPSEDEATLMAKARPVIFDLLDQALHKLDAMRCSEGQGLAEDLLSQKNLIAERAEEIRQRAPEVVEQYHAKLRQRVNELIEKTELRVSEQDLVKEVAVYADRIDISEELSRLAGHLDQFEQTIESDNADPAGRTLDFIAQEMLREANTIASKANDATISRASVEMKSAIDRIKEQVQNVE
jgi:uncharacterized protein (TIGR00255 family)